MKSWIVGAVLLVASLSSKASASVEVKSAEHDISPPLLLMTPAALLPPVEHAPIQGHQRIPARGGKLIEDPVRNRPLGPLPPVSAAPPLLFSFSGVGQNFQNLDGTTYNPDVFPPDTVGDVGPDHYISLVNTAFAIFDKTSQTLLYGSVPTNTLFGGFSGAQGLCASTNNGDGVVVYDPMADRWIIGQFAIPATGTTVVECVAISVSGDPLGQWYRYVFGPYQTPAVGPDGGFIFDGGGQVGLDTFSDYPKLAAWTDGYYATYNLFAADTLGTESAFAAKLCAFDKASMLNGADATQQCFQLSQNYNAGDQFYGDVLPVDFDGTLPPPDGAPGLFVNFMTGQDGGSYLGLWKLHADFANPQNATLNGGSEYPFNPTYVSNVAPFIPAICAAIVTDGFSRQSVTDCVLEPDVQATGNNQVDGLGDRMMFRASYRRFAADGGYESLLANHTVFSSNSATANTGIRWYEIRDPFAASPAVYQQQTFAPDDFVFRWMASVAQDSVGNIALGYSATSPDAGFPDGGPFYPSIFYTGRTAADPLGTMRAEQALALGVGSQQFNDGSDWDRWGDYSNLVVDPVDDCTFWYTQELIPYTAAFNWSTMVGTFRFPGCQPVARYTLGGVSTATTGTPVTVNASVVDSSGTTITGYSGSATLTASDGGIAAAQVTIANGVGTASVTFTEAGTLTLTATDNANKLLRGSTPVTVSVGPKGYVINGLPGTVEAGQTLTVTATAVDAYGNVAAGYSGSGAARVSSSDTRASIPATLSFSSGVSQPFPLTFATAGTQTVVITDKTTASITTSTQVTVVVGAVAKYGFGGVGSSIKSGTATTFNILALDAYGNAVTSYSGSAQVTSSDAKAVLPSNPSFTGGVASGVSITFKTSGAQTITATDAANAGLTGSTTVIVGSSGCGCGAESAGVDVASLLGLLAVARSLSMRRRR